MQQLREAAQEQQACQLKLEAQLTAAGQRLATKQRVLCEVSSGPRRCVPACWCAGASRSGVLQSVRRRPEPWTRPPAAPVPACCRTTHTHTHAQISKGLAVSMTAVWANQTARRVCDRQLAAERSRGAHMHSSLASKDVLLHDLQARVSDPARGSGCWLALHT